MGKRMEDEHGNQDGRASKQTSEQARKQVDQPADCGRGAPEVGGRACVRTYEYSLCMVPRLLAWLVARCVHANVGGQHRVRSVVYRRHRRFL